MGLLNRSDSLIYRGYFREMCKLIGISVAYQYIVKKELTIHSEDNSELSMPIRLNILFDENPSVNTLNRLGWVSETEEQKPVVANLPYNTPNLTVNCRITIETSDGIARPRVYKITKIQSDLEFPDAFTCAVVPVFDQIPQQNKYSLVNNEKVSQELSDRTSNDQPYRYLNNTEDIDTTPKQQINWHNKYSFIDDDKSPYSG